MVALNSVFVSVVQGRLARGGGAPCLRRGGAYRTLFELQCEYDDMYDIGLVYTQDRDFTFFELRGDVCILPGADR